MRRCTVRLRSPVVIGALAGIAFGMLGFRLPAIAGSVINALAGMTLPLMLIVVGSSIARMDSGIDWRTLWLIPLRFIAGILVPFGLCLAGGLDGTDAGIVVLLVNMPAAAMSYVYAQRFGADAGRVGAYVLASTIAGLALVPLLLILVGEQASPA